MVTSYTIELISDGSKENPKGARILLHIFKEARKTSWFSLTVVFQNSDQEAQTDVTCQTS